MQLFIADNMKLHCPRPCRGMVALVLRDRQVSMH